MSLATWIGRTAASIKFAIEDAFRVPEFTSSSREFWNDRSHHESRYFNGGTPEREYRIDHEAFAKYLEVSAELDDECCDACEHGCWGGDEK